MSRPALLDGRFALFGLASIIFGIGVAFLASGGGTDGTGRRSPGVSPDSAANTVLIQARGEPELRQGRFLVATRDLRDPNFAETVVLLVKYGEMGAMGIVVNRATKVRLSAVLPEIDRLRQSSEMLFVGGPVARSGITFLVHSETEPEDAEGVFGKVYVSASRDLLERVVGNSQHYRHYRVFAGHSGWAPGQLEAEVAAGAWNIMPPDSRSIFDPAPGAVWPRLIDRTTLRLAALRPAAAVEGHFDLLARVAANAGN